MKHIFTTFLFLGGIFLLKPQNCICFCSAKASCSKSGSFHQGRKLKHGSISICSSTMLFMYSVSTCGLSGRELPATSFPTTMDPVLHEGLQSHHGALLPSAPSSIMSQWWPWFHESPYCHNVLPASIIPHNVTMLKNASIRPCFATMVPLFP